MRSGLPADHAAVHGLHAGDGSRPQGVHGQRHAGQRQGEPQVLHQVPDGEAGPPRQRPVQCPGPARHPEECAADQGQDGRDHLGRECLQGYEGHQRL